MKEDSADNIIYMSNEAILNFDGDDTENSMSLSNEDEDSYLSEENEANDLAYELKLPSPEHAMERVGTNVVLFSWLESKLNAIDPETVAEYDKITDEIDRIYLKLKMGLESILHHNLKKSLIIASKSAVEYCRNILLQYVNIVLDVGASFTFVRKGDFIVNDNDVIEALSRLGRIIYFNPDTKEDEEEKEITFFDPEVIKILIDTVRKDISISENVYKLIQSSFEDFFGLIVSNAVQLQKEYKEEESVTVEDMKMVLMMWKNSPYNPNSCLVHRLNV